MRLPQSISHLSTRVFSVVTFTILVTMLPLSVRAATQLTCAPSTVHFGNVVIGQSETAVVVLTNSGETRVTVSAINWSGPQFAASAPNLPLIIPAGQSASVNVTFSPSATGWTPGTVTFASNASDPTLQLAVRGTGVTSTGLGASPSSVSFGQVTVGASSTVPVVLTNLRSYKVKISAFQATGSGFSVTGPALPITLSAGQSITLQSTFVPPSAGMSAGSVFISGPNLNVPLTGMGTTTTTVGQLSVGPTPLNFGNVTVGTTGTQPVTLSASGASVTVSSDTSSNPQYVLKGASFPFTIPAGQSVQYTVSFTPTGGGTVSGSLSFTSNASNSPNVTLSGTGTIAAGQLSVAPAPLNFGNVTVGTTGTQPITLSASGASVTVSADTSNNSQFALVGAALPFTISAGQSKTYNVSFTPTAGGTVTGSLSFTSNASNTPSLSLSGTGTTATAGQLSVAPAPLNFGNVTVGSTGTQPITLSASGASVTVSSDASSSSQYVLNGASFPFTIPAGQSVQYNVSFTPTVSGTVAGSLTFTSNAATSKTTESLTGVGAVQQYSVNLSWNGSTGVAGYNVYRSTSSSGTYSKINPTLDANTAYTDSSVTSGQTYYYEATAVNSSGQESARSTPPVQAAIP